VVAAFIGLGAAQLDAHQATPLFGVIERILAHSMEPWVAVLAIVMLREEIKWRAMSLKASPHSTRLLDEEKNYQLQILLYSN
jgi:hypothetical protein